MFGLLIIILIFLAIFIFKNWNSNKKQSAQNNPLSIVDNKLNLKLIDYVNEKVKKINDLNAEEKIFVQALHNVSRKEIETNEKVKNLNYLNGIHVELILCTVGMLENQFDKTHEKCSYNNFNLFVSDFIIETYGDFISETDYEALQEYIDTKIKRYYTYSNFEKKNHFLILLTSVVSEASYFEKFNKIKIDDFEEDVEIEKSILSERVNLISTWFGNFGINLLNIPNNYILKNPLSDLNFKYESKIRKEAEFNNYKLAEEEYRAEIKSQPPELVLNNLFYQLDCNYENATDFNYNIAFVKRVGSKKWEAINSLGEVIINEQFDEVGTGFSVDGFATVLNDHKWGFCNSVGEMLIEYIFNDVKNFSDEFAIVSFDDEIYRYIDNGFKLIENVSFEECSPFNDGISVVRLLNDEKFSIIDKSFKVLSNINYSNVFIYDLEFSEGFIFIESDNERGYVDRTGKIKIPIDKGIGEGFSEGLACIQSEKTCYFIDKKGKKVFEDAYYRCGRFVNGLAPVAKLKREEYEEYLESFKIYAKEMWEKNNTLMQPKDASAFLKWGYIDKNNKVIIDFEFEEADSFSNNLARVKKNGKYGFINYPIKK